MANAGWISKDDLSYYLPVWEKNENKRIEVIKVNR